MEFEVELPADATAVFNIDGEGGAVVAYGPVIYVELPADSEFARYMRRGEVGGWSISPPAQGEAL